MSKRLLTLFYAFCLTFLLNTLNAQNCFSTGLNGYTLNLGCSQTCTPLTVKIADLKTSSEYTYENIPYAPRPFGGGAEAAETYIDDRFSQAFENSFPFCFYDSAFTKFVIGSNGVVTFDVTQANCGNAYRLDNGAPVPIPYLGPQVCTNSAGPKYSRYSIFSPYHDIDPSRVLASPNRRIAFRIYNFAPCRVQVINFFEIPLFGHNSQLNTSQIVIYEATGVVEIFIKEKRLDTDGSVWNLNLAILGLQKDDTKAHPVAGKNATVWEEYLTGYRFTPAGPGTKFVKSELYSLSGTLLQTTTQSAPSANAGMRDVSFPSNVCLTDTTKFLVKTYYSICSPTSSTIVYTDTITINAIPPLAGTATSANPSCQGAANGTATVVPGTTSGAPFEFSMDGGNTWQNNSLFSNLSAGTYNFMFRNNVGCVSPPIPVTIAPGTPLSGTVAVTNALCNGSTTGTATVTVSNAGGFEYSLDNTIYQSSNVFSGLAAGTYTAYFREPSGCNGSQSFTITEPPALTASFTVQPVKCNGQTNGQINLTAGGGTAPYQYSVDGTTYQASPVFNVAAGIYTCYVKDQKDCITTMAVTVSEPLPISATFTMTNASCNGGADGTLTINASGGTGNFQYSLSGNYQASNVFNVAPGTYAITVRDANQCTFTLNNLTVGLNNDLLVNPMPDPAPICQGSGLTLQPQTNAIQFSWSPATGLSAANIKNPVASPSVTTEYILTARLGICTAYDTVTVSIMPAPVPNAGLNGNICYGQSYTLSGSGGVSYSWMPSSAFSTSNTAQNPEVSPSQTTQYSLSVVDANGCSSLQPASVTVYVTPPIVVIATRDTVVAKGDQVQLNASSAATDYAWSPSIGLNDPFISDPVATVTNDITYLVTATTSAGCKGEAYVKLTVFDGPEIYVPGAFTPNNDGKNDIFRPFPVGIKRLNYFRVFNRWGELIYSTSTFHQGWDGTIRGLKQSTGSYIWMVEGVTKDDKIIRKKGSVVLIR
jgi:gliding motility-associated-like protein